MIAFPLVCSFERRHDRNFLNPQKGVNIPAISTLAWNFQCYVGNRNQVIVKPKILALLTK